MRRRGTAGRAVALSTLCQRRAGMVLRPRRSQSPALRYLAMRREIGSQKFMPAMPSAMIVVCTLTSWTRTSKDKLQGGKHRLQEKNQHPAAEILFHADHQFHHHNPLHQLIFPAKIQYLAAAQRHASLQLHGGSLCRGQARSGQQSGRQLWHVITVILQNLRAGRIL